MLELDEHTRDAKFSEMDLRVGQRVQLISAAPPVPKLYTHLIGDVEGEFLILKVPREAAGAIPVREGQRVEVRLFSGVSVFSFESQIQTLLLNPRNYMLMSFPTQIHATRLRSHVRVATHMEIEVLKAPQSTHALQGFHLQDLSGSGAMVVGKLPLGEKGAAVTLGWHFYLHATGKQESVEIGAEIQSIEQVIHPDAPQAPALYKHGVKFDVIDPRIVLLVQELSQHNL